MLMPTVDHYMTREPYSIAPTENLATAQQLMHAHLIRHLPVVDGNQVVGLLVERDVGVLEGIAGVALDHVEVARVMRPPVEVWGETPLDEVSELMTAHKSDCVVVRGGHGVEGIFTATDALEALGDLLRRATA